MKPTRSSTLGVVAVVFALLAWLLLRGVYSKLPPLPWTGVPALLIAAAVEAWIGRDLRARIAGRDDLSVAAEFVNHVRNEPASESERHLLAAAFEAVRAEEAV